MIDKLELTRTMTAKAQLVDLDRLRAKLQTLPRYIFDQSFSWAEMRQDPQGDWVRWSDIEDIIGKPG